MLLMDGVKVAEPLKASEHNYTEVVEKQRWAPVEDDFPYRLVVARRVSERTDPFEPFRIHRYDCKERFKRLEVAVILISQGCAITDIP